MSLGPPRPPEIPNQCLCTMELRRNRMFNARCGPCPNRSRSHARSRDPNPAPTTIRAPTHASSRGCLVAAERAVCRVAVAAEFDSNMSDSGN